jgi:cell division protein FtsI (penicillin-binding protein 3)
LQGGYDATRPLHVARFTISDYHPARRWLSVPEILVHSSNIGSALMALDVGTDLQRQYLDRFGLLSPTSTDLPEVGEPLVPNPWREINTMTIGFGHGIAVTPLQLSSAVAAVVNGGILRRPTLLRRGEDAPVDGKRVLSTRTSRQMRSLMRLVVSHGTGARAEVPGYRVGGKTGTAEKQIGGRYHADKRISSFVGAFPMDAPRFVVLAMLDEPKGSRRTFNYATGGWVAAPVVSRVIQRMAPVLGIAPAVDDPETLQAKTMTRKERLTIAIQQAIAESRGTRVAAN